eukprot:CAMPEP_0204520358 /NCGR_PEP_ID=MMETSP0661-20131031/5222_1 /ASSEMBLY_ACC=CAM_ASM_000606 /TAXON_ID=109239 /ORGANISM="Alexandrium margalefi, Strain AMGDE01CS-322" /LENGTH=215 /DNA_ID=CAMNT_0051525913 /DNA_START=67 /DNA_END=714 /DNA_ORIENTATION=-
MARHDVAFNVQTMEPVNDASGFTVTGGTGVAGGGFGVGATMRFTLTVTPKLQEGNELKVWGTASGPFGLPSACGLKTSPSTATQDVYAALEAWAAAECQKAGEGLKGEWRNQHMGLNGGSYNLGKQGLSIEWTPTIQALSFEGDDVPRSTVEAIGQFLKDGEEFQAQGTLRQNVATAFQNAYAGMVGDGRSIKDQLEELQGRKKIESSSKCCSLL